MSGKNLLQVDIYNQSHKEEVGSSMKTYSEMDVNIYVSGNSHLLRVSIDIVWKVE